MSIPHRAFYWGTNGFAGNFCLPESPESNGSRSEHWPLRVVLEGQPHVIAMAATTAAPAVHPRLLGVEVTATSIAQQSDSHGTTRRVRVVAGRPGGAAATRRWFRSTRSVPSPSGLKPNPRRSSLCPSGSAARTARAGRSLVSGSARQVRGPMRYITKRDRIDAVLSYRSPTRGTGRLEAHKRLRRRLQHAPIRVPGRAIQCTPFFPAELSRYAKRLRLPRVRLGVRGRGNCRTEHAT